MLSWNEWRARAQKSKDPYFLDKELSKALANVGRLCGGRDVLLYASGFLQKPAEQQYSDITGEDINGFMEAAHPLSCKKGLVLVIHTPGGELEAVKSIVEYLHGKFDDITAIVPYMAMSGGSMISLACNRIIMGQQSQIGPIDPQMLFAGMQCSARGVVSTFKRAEKDIMKKGVKYAHLWSPILQTMGPSLVAEAEEVLEYSKHLVRQWLQERMFGKDANAKTKARRIAKFFNAETKEIYTHGQRIAIDALRRQGVKVEPLENKQAKLQEAVISSYHLMTLIFELTTSIKLIANQNGNMWVKSIETTDG